jgi:hypothetical protein
MNIELKFIFSRVRHYNEVTAVQPAVTVVRNRVIY